MTTNDLIQAVRAKLPPVPDDERAGLEARIMQAAYAALSRLAVTDAAGPGRFTKTFTLEAAAGDAPLASALEADEPLLLEAFSNCSVFISGSDYPVPPAPDRGYQRLAPAGRCSYVLEDESLRVVGPDGAYAGPVTLRYAPFVPLLSSVSAPQDDALVEIVAAMVAQPPARRPSPQTTPSKGDATK